MGFFAGLNDEKYDRQYTDRDLLRRILEYFKHQTTRFVWVLLLVVVLAVIGAALPVVYLTAHHMMFYTGSLGLKSRVLIHSAAGGVGIAAIQLAKTRECVILGTASPSKHDFLRALGNAVSDLGEGAARGHPLHVGRGLHVYGSKG